MEVPLRVPPIAGETTASYLARTAAANALRRTELLYTLQPAGRRVRTAALRPVAVEIYLSPLRLLADLVRRPADHLARALPHLRTAHLLHDDTPQVRSAVWPRGSGQARCPAARCTWKKAHWEGDLIVVTANRSAIGTFVDRTTRYVKLLHLPDSHSAENVRDALLQAITTSSPAPPASRLLLRTRQPVRSIRSSYASAVLTPEHCRPA